MRARVRAPIVLFGAAACAPGRDLDRDGYVDVADGGYDCNDLDDSIHPQAGETCDDFVDDDCDGAQSPCALAGVVQLSGADANWEGEAAGDRAGWSVGGGGDVDGDGLDDIMVGAPGHDGSGEDAGAAYLILGPATGAGGLGAASAVLYGGAPGEALGGAASIAGDLDGDGFDDLIVGGSGSGPNGAGAGAAWVVGGPLTGRGSVGEVASGWLPGREAGAAAGWSASGAGDVDADGRADILVGAPGDDAAGTDAGAVYLLLGPVRGEQAALEADAVLLGDGPGARAGTSAAAAGDVDGDGYDDVVAGACDSNGKGVAWLVRGPFGGTRDLATADAALRSGGAADFVGSALDGAADLDGDGRDDLVIGGSGRASGTGAERSGAAWVALGPVSGDIDLDSIPDRIDGWGAGIQVGWAVAGAGRVDSDPFADLLVGAPGHSGGRGAALLLYGPISGVRDGTEADARFEGAGAGALAGWSAGAAGDVAGNAHGGLLVGAPGAADQAGAAWLVLGHGM